MLPSVSQASIFLSERMLLLKWCAYMHLFKYRHSIAVWSRKWYIIAPLILVILGHWSLLLHGTYSMLDQKSLSLTFICKKVSFWRQLGSLVRVALLLRQITRCWPPHSFTQWSSIFLSCHWRRSNSSPLKLENRNLLSSSSTTVSSTSWLREYTADIWVGVYFLIILYV